MRPKEKKKESKQQNYQKKNYQFHSRIPHNTYLIIQTVFFLYLKQNSLQQFVQQQSAFIKVQEMCAWKLCKEDLLVMQHTFESEMTLCTPKSIYNSHSPSHNFRKCLSSNNKVTQKISLRKTQIDKKTEQFFRHKNKVQERQTQQLKPQKNIQNSEIFFIKSLQKDHFNNKKYQQPKNININQSVFEQYFIMPTTLQPTLRPARQSNVKINYINPQKTFYNNTFFNHHVSFCKVKKDEKIPLRRMNTLPVALSSTEPARCQQKQSLTEQEKLSKSMNYNESVKFMNLKLTQNLNEIQCVKAQSLLDQQQMRDEVSFVLSPIDEGLQFGKSLSINELWKDFAGREDVFIKQISTPNSIPSREIQI